MMSVKRICARYRVVIIINVIFIILLLNINELRRLHSDHVAMMHLSDDRVKVKPIVWIYGSHLETGYLKHVERVFDRIGYSRATSRITWDVLWSFEYPYGRPRMDLHSLMPHQRINHFPGCGHITDKVTLATSDLKHIPKAFRIPEEKDKLLRYAKIHRNTQWIQKSNKHRGVKIKPLAELDLFSLNSFVQQYVDNPYLIDGRRFDIGIYVTITSVDPLTIYTADWLIRFCPQEYHPFDAKILDKYVISDKYMPVWKVPPLSKYYERSGSSAKEAILWYLASRGENTTKLIDELSTAIREVCLSKEQAVIKAVRAYSSKRNFFEMVRFDFIVDEKLNVYLMEVNMSPNLSSSHFPPNRLMFEQLVFSLLSLVGIARSPRWDWKNSHSNEAEMVVSTKDINVKECLSDECQENCVSEVCQLCSHCIHADQAETLKLAFLEHNNRMRWRRIFPKPFQSQQAAHMWKASQDMHYQLLTPSNKFLTTWFRHKCLHDSTWCS